MDHPRRALAGVALSALAAGCAHAPRPEIAGPAAALRCEDAHHRLYAASRTFPAADLARRAVTAPLSVATTGLAYAGNVGGVAAAGFFAGGLVCFPFLAIDA